MPMLTAKQVLRFRLARRWTLHRFATQVGIATATLQRMEKGDPTVTPLSRARIEDGMRRIEAKEAAQEKVS